MDAATRVGTLSATGTLLGAAAFAVCLLAGAGLWFVGVALVAAGLVAAALAAREARGVLRRARELRGMTEAAAGEGHYGARIQTVHARDELDELQNAIAKLVQTTHEPLQALSGGAERIAQGDLSVELHAEGNGSSADLVKKFGRMRDSLKQLVGEVQANAMEVTSSAEELSAAIEEISSSIQEVGATIVQVSQGAQSQSDQMAQASASLRQTADQMQRTAEEAKRAAEQARLADETAMQGTRNASEASRRMNDVTARVDQAAAMVSGFADNMGRISEFVKVIVRISDQTNLLALNAAIEAARAGEHGRGFTVVADEVRKLAEESARGAEEVQRVISQVSAETARIVSTMESTAKEVKQGDDVVRQAIGGFEDITQQVSEIRGLVAAMAASVDDMARRGAEVAQNVESVTASAEETAASAEEVSAAIEEQTASIEQVASTSQSLARSAAQGLESIRRFRTSEGPARAPRPQEAPDMPPVFRPPQRAAPPERKRVALTKHSEERARDGRGG